MKFDRVTALYCGAIVLAVLSALAAFISPAGAWPLAAMSVACVFSANLDRFSEFSAGASGVTAKVREAQGAIQDMRRMIEVVGAAELHQIQSSGRWGGNRDEDVKRLHDAIIQLMRDTGISNDRIREIKLENWDRYVRFDYVLAILGSKLPNGLSEQAAAEWQELRNFENPPSPAKLAHFLAQCGDKDESRAVLLQCYEQYWATGVHPDETAWRARNEIPRIESASQLQR